MLTKIVIKSKGLTPKQFQFKVDALIKTIDGSLPTMGSSTVDGMRGIIEQERKRGPSRSGNRLAKSINHYIEDMGIYKLVGVGKIAEMDSKAPYWSIVNYGGIVPSSAVGFFGEGNPPDSSLIGKGTEPFYTNKYGFFMQPKVPIRAMNFIESTVNKLSRFGYYWSNKMREIWRSIEPPPDI